MGFPCSWSKALVESSAGYKIELKVLPLYHVQGETMESGKDEHSIQ